MNKVTLYHATWCAPCKALKPHFEQISKGYLADMGVEFEMVDVDEAPTVTQLAGVRSVPTVIASVNGKDHWVTSRVAPKMELEIEYLLTDNG